MRDDSGMHVRRVSAFEPPATDLVAAMLAELDEVYDTFDRHNSPTATPEELSPPGGAFVVLEDDGVAVAGGGLKRLEPDIAEIKRMYVVPAARSRGLARALLAALEDAARDLGYRTVRLDTGALQRHAQALYRSAGYTEIAPYNVNPYAAYWGEKAL